MAFRINTITGLDYLSGLRRLYLSVNNLTTIDVSQNTVLQDLGLGYNLFADAGINNLVLPDSLQYLNLGGNQIVTFNPTQPLPSVLGNLYLDNNQMTTAGYTASEPWANAMTVIPGRGNIYFGSNTNSVSGTNLETILIAKGWTVNV